MRAFEEVDDAEERCFSSPVWPNESQEIILGNFDAYIFENRLGWSVPTNAFSFQCRRDRSSLKPKPGKNAASGLAPRGELEV